MKQYIMENQRGFLFRDGQFVRLLENGVHRLSWKETVEIVSLDQPVASKTCRLDVLLRDPRLKAQTVQVEVADQQLALHFVNGSYTGCLPAGRYAYWTVFDRHEFLFADLSQPRVAPEVPAYVFSMLPARMYTKVEVADFQKARLYFDGKLAELLDAGVYYFWNGAVKVEAELVDTRLMQMDITGQEILTQDKVALRINFVCRYRITDFVKIRAEIDDYREQLHVAAQLALRDYVGRYRLDELLENKDRLSACVFQCLREKGRNLYVEVEDAGVKDVVLPGEIREIMNTVLVAEKRAQAGVIARREEVASTRSLLNTAKLMEENKTLYKLKELEYLERICENVGSINVGGGDILSQLAAVIRGPAEA